MSLIISPCCCAIPCCFSHQLMVTSLNLIPRFSAASISLRRIEFGIGIKVKAGGVPDELLACRCRHIERE